MTLPNTIRPRRGLETLRAYQPRPDEPGISLRLDNNEAPCVVAEIAARALATTTAEELRRYPVPAPLESLIADRWSIDPSRVVVTAGADDALARVLLAMLDRERVLVSVVPTFEMIPSDAQLTGAKTVEVEWGLAEFPTDRVIEAINASGSCVGAVTVVTPNNPTGFIAPLSSIRRVADAALRVGAVLVVDLAYAEFAESDPTEDLLEIENVVVVRTLSKAWGLAGMRVGYAVAREDIAGWIRAAGGPYPTSGPSLKAATFMLAEGSKIVEEFSEEVSRERRILGQVLEASGFEVSSSEANFVFARGPASDELVSYLRAEGILIRSFRKPGLEDCVRITCPGTRTDFDRLMTAIIRNFPPRAILFDMDGVIADVSGSYRKAIAETCAHFGIETTSQRIEQVKLEGNANNDWKVTYRILERSGISVPYEDVVTEFERRYHGDDRLVGLCESETMLLALAQLRAVTARFPSAIVTGRPRSDAASFIERYGLQDCFDAIVCLEDADEPKPSPKPLLTALDRLGLTADQGPTQSGPVWMIGDTVDDLRAAITAGAIPLGVRAPGAPDTTDAFLADAGAALVRPHILELFETTISGWSAEDLPEQEVINATQN
ncbi:MAG: TIGR01548 family HAD-type hydrolase [Phycisphaerales bacterium JB065]